MRRHFFKIFLLFLPVLLWSAAGMLYAATPGQYAEYYRLLESITAISAVERLPILQDYLKQHPDFERVYLKILENYQTANDLAGAQVYFNTIKTKPDCYRNSMWALACLFARQKQHKRALKAYHMALQADTPPPDLLKNYADFITGSPVKPAGPDTLFFAKLNEESKILFYAFLDYQQYNSTEALKKLISLKQNKLTKLPVFYIYGCCFMLLNRFTRADSIFRMGLEISGQLNDREYEILFTCARGTLQLNKADYNEAIRLFEAALPRARAINDIRYLLFIYENLGALYYKTGEYKQAIHYFDLALTTAQKNRRTERLKTYLLRTALSKYNLNQYSQALTLYDKCENIAQNTGSLETLFNTYLVRGDLYKNLFQLELAKREYQKAQMLSKKTKNPALKRQTILNQADNLIALNDPAGARKLFHQAITQITDPWEYKSKAYCQAQIARSYMLEKNYSMAIVFWNRARQTAEKTDNRFYSASYLLMQAICDVRSGRFDTALIKMDTVLNRGRRQNSTYLLRNALSKKGWACEEMGLVDKAVFYYKKAIPYTEVPRGEIAAEALRIRYFSDNYQVYRGLARCYRNKYLQKPAPVYLDSLFYYEEKQRGRALKDNLYAGQTERKPGSRNENYSSACRNLQRKQYHMRQQAGTIRTTEQWDKLMAGLEAAKYELVSQKLLLPDSLPKDNGKRSVPSEISLTCIRRNLGKHHCGLLLYHIDEKGSFVLVAAGDSTDLVTLDINPDSLRALVDSLVLPLRNITEESASDVPFRAATAHRLYNILFKPVEEQFPLPERLLIIPEGVLLNLPFEVLLQKKPQKTVYTPVDEPVYAKDFLLHQHSLFYSSTAAVFRDKKKSLLPKKRMLVFANPYTRIAESADKMLQFRFRTGWRFDPLPFADAEGENIKKIARTVHKFSREKATE